MDEVNDPEYGVTCLSQVTPVIRKAPIQFDNRSKLTSEMADRACLVRRIFDIDNIDKYFDAHIFLEIPS